MSANEQMLLCFCLIQCTSMNQFHSAVDQLKLYNMFSAVQVRVFAYTRDGCCDRQRSIHPTACIAQHNDKTHKALSKSPIGNQNSPCQSPCTSLQTMFSAPSPAYCVVA